MGRVRRRIAQVGSTPGEGPNGPLAARTTRPTRRHHDPVTDPHHEPRPLLPMLDRVTCSAMVDAMSQRHAHPAHVLDLVSPTPGRVLFGRAVTIRYNPRPQGRAAPRPQQLRVALLPGDRGGRHRGRAGPVQRRSPRRRARGGRKLARLRHNGLAGVLADGRLRDFDDLAGYAFVTYCRGETVRQGGNGHAGRGRRAGGDRGRGVLPGDWIYAYATGAVVVPNGDIAAMLEDAAGFEERDAASAGRMSHEDPATVIARGRPGEHGPHRVTLAPGDGIGPEVVAATRRVMEATGAASSGTSRRWGRARWRRSGRHARRRAPPR